MRGLPKQLGWVLASALMCIACSKGLTPSNRGGESNWLRSCVDDAECGPLDCLCGVCSEDCSIDNACKGTVANGACVASDDALVARLCEPAMPSAARPAAPGGVCLPECDESQPCEDGQVCLGGHCLPEGRAQVLLATPGGPNVLANPDELLVGRSGLEQADGGQSVQGRLRINIPVGTS